MIQFTTIWLSALSCAINWLSGGEPVQTLSSRAYVESERGSRNWRRVRRAINWLFFWEADHCRDWCRAETERARRLIQLNKV